MKKLLLSIVSAFLLFALSAQVSEDFSDYTVGGKLAQQAQAMGRDYWTTWDNAPGTNDDGAVGEIAGNKCGKFERPCDQVLLLGKKTTGKWNHSFKIYIPAGRAGFFNILADFAGSASTWALQVYLGSNGQTPYSLTPGVGTMHITASNSVGFTFQHDVWTDVKIFIDLDDDYAEIFINGTMIYSWQYTLGTFGEGCPRVIDAFNLYPHMVGAEFYIDDIVFTQAQTAEVLFETNFDELAAGTYVAQSYPTWFETWENAPGTAEDALITTEQAQTQPNSAKLTWPQTASYGTDLVFMAGDKTFGEYTVDFDIYIPNNGRAYFNLLQIFDRGNGGQDSEWAVGVYWNVSGSGGPVAGTYVRHNAQNTNFTFSFNTWIPVHFYVNLDDDIASIKINNVQVLEWQYSITESGDMGIRQLAAVDFFPPQNNSTFYIDNFKYATFGDGETYPIMNVTPTAISEIVVPGANVTKTVTVANTGTSMGDYFTWVELDFDPPTGTNNYTITYSSDTPGGGVGYQDECTVEVAAKYPLSFYCDKVGTFINKVAYYMYQASADNKLTARVYGGGAFNSPGEILAEVTINNAIVGAWNEFTLPSPILLDGQDIWVAFEMIQPAGAYLISYDAGDARENSNWTRRNGGSWSQMFTVGNPPQPTGIIMIKAFAQGDASAVPGCWISFTGDTYGSVPKNSSKTFNVVLNATGLAEGTYTATIFVSTSDVVNPLFTIPCTITVASGPFMSVNVTQISEYIFIDDAITIVTRPITVSNNGNEPGNYTATIEGTAAWLTLTGDISNITVPAGANKTFNAVLDAAGLQPNTYNATIVIITNDNNNPKFEIPCTLTADLGIDDFMIKTLVFPNPANDQVTVQSNTIINSIQVFNNMGQLVYNTTSINSDQTTINIASYTAGIYIMKIHTEAGSQSVKLIVR